MSLLFDGTPDLLALAGGRELQTSFMPWHFTTVSLPSNYDLGVAREWIWKNCSGRFSILEQLEDNGWQPSWIVGFETPGEASAFALVKDMFEITEAWF